jgi:23S rRNA pseudouridine1911/1915/1917 synthase
MWHCPDIQGIGSEIRPGIVHRIDKDTSGLLLIAKNSKAHAFFSDLFKSRKIYKEYTAVLLGKVSGDSGVVDLPIGRHPQDRKKMSIKSNRPRNAETRWTVLERFESATLVQFVIKTGRTHQIRVHSKAMGHPVAGDQVYRHKKKSRLNILNELDRQMLHASKICFDEPETGERICYHAPFHNDMATLIEKLRKSAD